MPIVSSTIVEDRPQVDDRRAVWEQHLDHLGVVHDVFYMAEAGADTTAIMRTRVAAIEAQLAEDEMAANLAEILAS